MSVQRGKKHSGREELLFFAHGAKTPLVLFEVCFINKFRIQNVFSYFSIDNRAVLLYNNRVVKHGGRSSVD